MPRYVTPCVQDSLTKVCTDESANARAMSLSVAGFINQS